MKKHGFTLIELIVVIAIIGVLAAILVPAMMGYVRKSKITTANTAAKSVYNGLNTAMVEMEYLDLPPRQLTGEMTVTGAEVIAQRNFAIPNTPTSDYNTLRNTLFAKVCQYFSDVAKVDEITFRLVDNGCEGVGVINGGYPGSYPINISIDDYVAEGGSWDSTLAMQYGLEENP